MDEDEFLRKQLNLAAKLKESYNKLKEKVHNSIIQNKVFKIDLILEILNRDYFSKLEAMITQLESPIKKPIVIYLIGPSGSCKSSLINVLVEQKVAKTGTTSPCTDTCTPYTVPGVKAKFIDTRGLFEGNNPVSDTNPLDDLVKHSKIEPPDIVLCCITVDQYRNLGDKFILEVDKFKKQLSSPEIPFILILTKVDDTLPDYIDPDCSDDIPKMKKVMEGHLATIANDYKRFITFNDQIYCKTKYIFREDQRKFDTSKTINIQCIRDIINYHCSMISQLYISKTTEAQLVELQNSIANKIILYSVIATGLLTPVPVVEGLFIRQVRTTMMYLIAELFDADTSYSVKTFEATKQMKFLLGLSICQSTVAGLLDISSVITFGFGYLLSTGISLTTQPFITKYIGDNFVKYCRNQDYFSLSGWKQIFDLAL